MSAFSDEVAHEAPDEFTLANLPRSDLGNARRLILRYGDRLKYVPRHGWRSWNGRFWASGDAGEAGAREFAHMTADAMFGEIDALSREKKRKEEESAAREKRISAARKWAVDTGNATRTRAMLDQASGYLSKDHEEWDIDPMALNVANGTLHFETDRDGNLVTELRKHSRGDYCTEMAPVTYDPDATAPNWQAHLDKCLPEIEEQSYLQRFFGYALTGLVDEQAFLILQGGGADGKSTTINAFAHMLGRYAMSVSIKTFLQNENRGGGDASPDLARLSGPARFVYVSEPKKGDRLDESGIKSMTGGDKMTARFLRKDIFEFFPVFKIFVPCNPLPLITSSDHGTWRRIKLLEWRVRIAKAEMDPSIPGKLKAEAAGILNWAIEGLGDWRLEGLNEPASVRAAIDRYKGESDPIGNWIAERLVVGSEHGPTDLVTLWDDYAWWCESQGFKPLSNRILGKALSDRHIEGDRVGGRSVRLGVGFKDGIDPGLPKYKREELERDAAKAGYDASD